MQITIHKDLRAKFGAARDQDPRPTCMAFAASDAHAGARPGWEPLSVEWAYYHALKREGGRPHQGTNFSTMLAALREDGQPVESRWPYIASLFTDLTAWAPPPLLTDPLFRRDSVPITATIGDLIKWLDDDTPVLFTMSISPAFYSPRDGVVAANEALMANRVHALVAVGYGDRGPHRFILVRNSWGEGWGLAGYAWIETTYLEPRLLHAATMGGDL